MANTVERQILLIGQDGRPLLHHARAEIKRLENGDLQITTSEPPTYLWMAQSDA